MPSTFSVARKIIEKDGLGLRGLNKGLTATIGRNAVFNMIYFGFYHSVKDHFPAYEVRLSYENPAKRCILLYGAFQDPTKEFIRKVGIGFTSGTIASIANIPIDVAKSRIQVSIQYTIAHNKEHPAADARSKNQAKFIS